MKKIVLLIAATSLVFISTTSFSQRVCATFEHLQEQLKNPAFAKKFQESERRVQDYIDKGGNGRTSSITIPLIVHVVYRTAEQNISDAQVQSQLGVLNEDFTATNSDYNNYDAGYTSVKGDMEIQYCIVQIRHVQTSKKSFTWNDGVKFTRRGGDDAIDPEQALNIWVCNLGQNLLGYAQFPGGDANTFGVVCHYKAFGRGDNYNLFPAYDKGRTLTHEIGHCLGLRHIWGDATCGNDFVGDTPLHNAANYGCPGEGHLSTCTGTPLEMWMNYMDYTDDACMYIFSDGQVVRADGFLATDAQLLSIQNSGACSTGHGHKMITSQRSPEIINDVTIYPTITKGMVTVDFTALNSGMVQLNIYNPSGILVMKQQMAVVAGENSKQLDLGSLANGFYLVQVNQNNRRSTQKIIISH